MTTQTEDKSRFGLTEMVLDVTVDAGDEMEERFVVRFAGRTGDALRFTVRRTVKDVRPPQKGPYGSMPSFREGIVGNLGQQWDCFVPIRDNFAVAHWVFGEREEDRILDHYSLAENGDLMLIDPANESPKPTTERRMGFRPQYD